MSIFIGNSQLTPNGASEIWIGNTKFYESSNIPSGFWYGDGSLNAIQNGYGNTLYTQKNLETPIQLQAGSTSQSWSGNRFCQIPTNQNLLTIAMSDLSWDNSSAFFAGASGTNTNSWTVDATNDAYTIRLQFHYGALTTSIYIGSIKLCINGTYYTLEQAVNNSLIEPLVIFWSGANNGNYNFGNVLPIYTGGNTGSGNYPGLDLWFQLKKGKILSAVQFYANRARGSTSYDDGFNGYAIKANTYRLLITR